MRMTLKYKQRPYNALAIGIIIGTCTLLAIPYVFPNRKNVTSTVTSAYAEHHRKTTNYYINDIPLSIDTTFFCEPREIIKILHSLQGKKVTLTINDRLVENIEHVYDEQGNNPFQCSRS